MTDEGRFPCSSLCEALPELRRPPAPEAVRFKIQATAQSAAQVACYLDARFVLERLDLVCSAAWSAELCDLPDGLSPTAARDGERLVHARCRLTLFGVAREDVGEGRDPKAAFSDALKRAAVHFGVGRALYAMRPCWLKEGCGPGELRRDRKGRLVLDRRSEEWCRTQYGRWLSERALPLFGEPLGHARPSGGAAAPRSDRDGYDDRRNGEQGEGARVVELREAERRPEEADCEPDKHHPEADSPPLHGASLGSAAERLRRWADTAGYGEQTVDALSGFLHGGADPTRLSPERLADLALVVEVAAKARLAERTLRGAVDQAADRDDLAGARRAFRERLIQRANETGLLSRRAA